MFTNDNFSLSIPRSNQNRQHRKPERVKLIDFVHHSKPEQSEHCAGRGPVFCANKAKPEKVVDGLEPVISARAPFESPAPGTYPAPQNFSLRFHITQLSHRHGWVFNCKQIHLAGSILFELVNWDAIRAQFEVFIRLRLAHWPKSARPAKLLWRLSRLQPSTGTGLASSR